MWSCFPPQYLQIDSTLSASSAVLLCQLEWSYKNGYLYLSAWESSTCRVMSLYDQLPSLLALYSKSYLKGFFGSTRTSFADCQLLINIFLVVFKSYWQVPIVIHSSPVEAVFPAYKAQNHQSLTFVFWHKWDSSSKTILAFSLEDIFLKMYSSCPKISKAFSCSGFLKKRLDPNGIFIELHSINVNCYSH